MHFTKTQEHLAIYTLRKKKYHGNMMFLGDIAGSFKCFNWKDKKCISSECKKCVQGSACGCMFTKGCGWAGGRVCHSPLTGPAALRCPACAFQALKWALCARGEREKRLEQLWRGRRCFIHLSPWQRTGAREICPLLEPCERYRETLKSHQNIERSYFNHENETQIWNEHKNY